MNIKQAIQGQDFDGFTTPLKGNTSRYVVAMTHNAPDIDVEQLENQAKLFDLLDNINVGGWKDEKDGKTYLDISTSFDDLTEATTFGKAFNQIAIFDTKDLQEIRL